MTLTFTTLVKYADFSVPPPKSVEAPPVQELTEKPVKPTEEIHGKLKIGGLVYNIQLVLPESRDTKVYDALFKSLREHLL